MILILDNYDSFVYNLDHYFQLLGCRTEVFRNDAITVEGIEAKEPQAIVVSPGPCDPQRSGVSLEAVRRLGGRIPILGVCLGHQCIGEAYGGRTVRAPGPMHGMASRIHHDGNGVFVNVPNPFMAGRYHSLIVAFDGEPKELEITARTEDGLIMGLQHREHLVVGVQFHPESILTEHGYALLQNFLAMIGERRT